jgi:hypothetical protein
MKPLILIAFLSQTRPYGSLAPFVLPPAALLIHFREHFLKLRSLFGGQYVTNFVPALLSGLLVLRIRLLVNFRVAGPGFAQDRHNLFLLVRIQIQVPGKYRYGIGRVVDGLRGVRGLHTGGHHVGANGAQRNAHGEDQKNQEESLTTSVTIVHIASQTAIAVLHHYCRDPQVVAENQMRLIPFADWEELPDGAVQIPSDTLKVPATTSLP